MIALRLRYQQLGGHVHCRMFSAKSKDYTFAKNGDLTFSAEEWPDVRDRFMRASVEVLNEAPPYPEFCRHPDKCAGLGSCPRDPTCAD